MNKKGFTLIELLAVIVILAVIALIATPVIMNAISNAKQGAWKDAAYGIIKATENVYAKNFSEVTDQVDTFFLYESGVMTSYPSGKSIDYKGSVPQDGGIVLHADGSITLAIHDGVNCATKSKIVSNVTISNKTKDDCFKTEFYYQTTSPFENLVKNADFNDGMTYWNAPFSSVTINNGIATYTGLGTDVISRMTQSVAARITGNKYYFKAKYRTISTDVQNLYLTATGVTITTGSPTINKWYTPSAIETAYNTGGSLNIYGTFATKELQLGKIIELDYVISINLTAAYGAGNEPTVSQMDNNLNKIWIDTTTNTPKRFTADGWINF